MESDLSSELQCLASEFGVSLVSEKFAVAMDERDELREFRREFHYPRLMDLPECQRKSDQESIYLCGHSLGLMPKSTRASVNKVMDCWATMPAENHTHGYLKAAFCELFPKEQMARVVGCKPHELVLMNGLTVNLHLLMLTFYKPTAKRFKIVMEEAAFPSDLYAVKSQLKLHGFSESEGLILLKPQKSDCELIEEDDIVKILREEGDSVALLLLPSTQYYTGQVFDIEKVTREAHNKGCFVFCDAAHSVGNVPLKLHDWSVDFAVWCTYKYLNSGAGGIGGAFIHERHLSNDPAVHGWWGNDTATKFQMKRDFEPVRFSADKFKLSNISPLLIAPLMSSLEIFDRVDEQKRYAKQKLLTGYLEYLLLDLVDKSGRHPLRLITPNDPRRRGSMLCVKFELSSAISSDQLHEKLQEQGVVCDVRNPGVIRVSPCPLYNSFGDVWRFIDILKKIAEAFL